MKSSESRTPFPPHFGVFAWRYLPSRLSSLLCRPALAVRPGAFMAAPRPSSARDVRASQVSGEPLCAFAPAFDPGRFVTPRPDDATTRPPPFQQQGPLTIRKLSRLNLAALALAVYASPYRSPDQDARLASGCWLGSTGWDWLPIGFERKVSAMLPTSASPFPRLRLAQWSFFHERFSFFSSNSPPKEIPTFATTLIAAALPRRDKRLRKWPPAMEQLLPRMGSSQNPARYRHRLRARLQRHQDIGKCDWRA